MNGLVLKESAVVLSNVADIFSSASRIVESNNWRAVELLKIQKNLEVKLNKIQLQSDHDMLAINYCYAYLQQVLMSEKYTSAQKRDEFIRIMNYIKNI